MVPVPDQMTDLAFTKMHGLGNDFVVLDGLHNAIEPTTAQLGLLTDRREGVGCDQVLLINPARNSDEDFSVRIFNADSSEVEQCGNGMRCVAAWLAKNGHVAPDVSNLRLGSKGGVVEAAILAPARVRVNMGIPELEPANIPFDAPRTAVTYAVELCIHDNCHTVTLGAISMGNPHAVIQVADVLQAPVEEMGAALGMHERFPRGVNVGFLQIINRQQLRLRVYERGVGETRACGSGACAAVVWARLAELVDKQVTVTLPGGELVISWEAPGQPVWMTGPARNVFTGQLSNYDRK